MAIWKKLRKAIKKTGKGEAIMAALETKKGRAIAAAALANTIGTAPERAGKAKSKILPEKGHQKKAHHAAGAKPLLKPSGMEARAASKKAGNDQRGAK